MNIPGIYLGSDGRIYEFTFSGLYLAIDKSTISISGNTMNGFKMTFNRVGNGDGLVGVWEEVSTSNLWQFNTDGTIVQTEANGNLLDSGFYINNSLLITTMLRRASFEEIGSEIRMFNFPNGYPNIQVPYSLNGNVLTIEYPEGPSIYTKIP
jgi:hypothetical protein